MLRRATTFGACALLSLTLVSCVPEGPPTTADAGAAQPARPASTRPQTKAPSAPLVPPGPPLTAPWEDTFDRAELGEDWNALSPGWHIENGKLCGKNARNRGVWLRRRLPVNARIEFDAYAESPIGDLKVELWGDGQSGATSTSYTNATSYLVIFGGWRNSKHVLARIDEHGDDRLEIDVDPKSDDERERPVSAGQSYRFKIERADGKTIVWSINGVEYFTFTDPEPLAGPGHEHFGFNDWEVPVCFDNLKVTPL